MPLIDFDGVEDWPPPEPWVNPYLVDYDEIKKALFDFAVKHPAIWPILRLMRKTKTIRRADIRQQIGCGDRTLSAMAKLLRGFSLIRSGPKGFIRLPKFVTVLHRLARKPETKTHFTDLDTNPDADYSVIKKAVITLAAKHPEVWDILRFIHTARICCRKDILWEVGCSDRGLRATVELCRKFSLIRAGKGKYSSSPRLIKFFEQAAGDQDVQDVRDVQSVKDKCV